MQATKKLFLLGEIDREYKRLQRPAAAVAKTDRSLRLSETRREGSLSDDRKVREYIGALHRYLNPTPVEQPTAEINWSTEPETPRPRKHNREAKRRLQWAQYGTRR